MEKIIIDYILMKWFNKEKVIDVGERGENCWSDSFEYWGLYAVWCIYWEIGFIVGIYVCYYSLFLVIGKKVERIGRCGMRVCRSRFMIVLNFCNEVGIKIIS